MLFIPQANRTRSCVSRLLPWKRYNPIVKHFWQKLLIDPVGFSLCGLFQVDRSLLTSVKT